MVQGLVPNRQRPEHESTKIRFVETRQAKYMRRNWNFPTTQSECESATLVMSSNSRRDTMVFWGAHFLNDMLPIIFVFHFLHGRVATRLSSCNTEVRVDPMMCIACVMTNMRKIQSSPKGTKTKTLTPGYSFRDIDFLEIVRQAVIFKGKNLAGRRKKIFPSSSKGLTTLSRYHLASPRTTYQPAMHTTVYRNYPVVTFRLAF